MVYKLSIMMQGCQESGGEKRSIGSQQSAKFDNDGNGAISISYTGGNGGRYYECIHMYLASYVPNICT